MSKSYGHWQCVAIKRESSPDPWTGGLLRTMTCKPTHPQCNNNSNNSNNNNNNTTTTTTTTTNNNNGNL